MKKSYLILLIVIGLFSLALYSTYAMFTANVETDDFVNLSASSLPTETQILEYERITINAKDTKIIDFNINNNTTSNLYYGAWYEMVEPTSINDNIIIAKYIDSENETFGSINASSKKKVTLIVKNDTDNNIIINIGVAYSETNSLNLPTNRELITDTYVPNLDTSGANYPKLVENMIPVMYNGSNWVKADSENSDENYKWYDYTNKQWANAVLVSSTNRNTYVEAEAGTVIPESEVLAYYVWIPRYKYKVFNVAKTMGTDSYNAKTTGIDIVFEEGTASTGEINCNNYSFATATSSATNETCSGTNGQYYTHPAFTFGDTELTGIWVGKFEISAPTDSSCYTNQSNANCETADLEPRTKPNVKSWRYNFVDSFEGVIQNMQSSGNEYGLSTNTSKVDSHMLKNIEWGAVAYLTHSDYGRCSNGSCSEIGINNYYSGSSSSRQYKTGCGSNAGSSSSGTCNEYTTSLGMNASSTGNIYGIYDLSGGAYEYVMGNMSSGSGSYTYNAKSAGSNFSYSASTAKYIDTYAYGISYGDQTAYNRARLGDATGEVVSSSYTAWNNDYAYFVNSANPWFARGGGYNSGSSAGVFGFYNSSGNAHSNHSARAALIAY